MKDMGVEVSTYAGLFDARCPNFHDYTHTIVWDAKCQNRAYNINISPVQNRRFSDDPGFTSGVIPISN
jgi:hypothetical protein